MQQVPAPDLDSPPLLRYGIPEYAKGARPAAGAHFSQAVTGAYYVRLVSVFCRLVTDGAAAARSVIVEYLDPEGARFGLSGAPVTQSASATNDWAFEAFQPAAEWPVDDTVLVPLTPLILLPTMSWRLFVDNIQAGDQLSQIRFVQERFYTHGRPFPAPPSPGE